MDVFLVAVVFLAVVVLLAVPTVMNVNTDWGGWSWIWVRSMV